VPAQAVIDKAALSTVDPGHDTSAGDVEIR